MNKERHITRNEIGKLILIRVKGRIEEVVVRSVSPNGKFMKGNIGHESVWLDVGNYPICDILPEARWVRDLCGLPGEEKGKRKHLGGLELGRCVVLCYMVLYTPQTMG